MLKTLAIILAILIAALNVAAQGGSGKRAFGGKHVVKRGVVRVGPSTTYLKQGFTTEQVVRLLGKPAAVSHGDENGVPVARYEFSRSENRVLVAEFVNGLLVSSHTESIKQIAYGGR